MTNQQKHYILKVGMKRSLGFISSFAFYLAGITSAFAQGGAGENVSLQTPTGSIANIPLQNVPQFIITALFVIGVIVAVAFLIYGGIKWILSGGDKAAVDAARKHIVAAIIGLVIVAGAFFILNVVFALLGVSSPLSGGKFCIPTLQKPTC